MPKISASSVAEHRAAQRAQLIRAAADQALEDGIASVTLGSVGARAGLARSSVYEYFDSREDLLVAVAISAFEQWGRDLGAALDGVELGLPRLRRYIEATMAMSADGRHDLAAELRKADLSPARVEQIVALHNALAAPLLAVLTEAGVERVEDHAPLVQAVIGAGISRVVAGADPAVIAADVTRLVTEGLPRRDAAPAPRRTRG